MTLWVDMLTYQLSSAAGLSGLMQKKDDAPDSQGFEARKDGLLSVVALLEDCDCWNILSNNEQKRARSFGFNTSKKCLMGVNTNPLLQKMVSVESRSN
eukprot:3821922-Ditylum_brightwellii.AAC.1